MKTLFFIRTLALPLLLAGISLSSSADEQRQKPASPAVVGAQLDLNTADQKTLEAVPVIGPDGARAIIAARPFSTINDLDKVKGISAERLEQIRAKVTVATPAVAPRSGSRLVMPTTATGDRAQPKVDLNTAELKTLAAIPTIGAETAKAIVAARPFTSVDDLSRLNGMNAERLEQIRAHVVVTPSPSSKVPAP